jgi:hypothetical protein
MFQCISLYFNVFECIYWHCNWNLLSHSHCNVFTMHTHLHIFFLHSTQGLHSQHAIPLYFFFPFPLIRSNFHTYNLWKNHISILTSRLYITPHSTFHVVIGCAEHSGAQVHFTFIILIINLFQNFFLIFIFFHIMHALPLHLFTPWTI